MPLYENDDTIVGGETARASEVNENLNAIEAGFMSVETELKRGIKLPSAEATDHVLDLTPVQRANKVLGFNAAGALEAAQGVGDFQGAWQATTAYQRRDIVSQAPNGSLYQALSTHASGGDFATDLAGGKWIILIDLTGLLTINNRIITSSTAAVAGDDLMVDVSGGPVVVTLPASPSINDSPITITHIDGDVLANVLTIARNGELMQGVASNLVVDVDGASFRLMYSDPARGWRVSNI